MSTQRIPLRERLRRGRAANGAGALLPGTGEGRRRISLVESFNYAVEGIIHVLRTHRNMRIHFAAAAVVLILALWIGVDRIELVVLLLAIAFVLIAEMVNSAIEAAIDVATSSFDPLAKLAKDIAAGAVLIASINAIAVGYLVFSGPRQRVDHELLRPPPRRADQADDHRADPRDHHRDRDEGDHRPRHAAARRAPVRPRRDRLRGLDGGHAHARPERAPVLRFDDHVRAWQCSSPTPGSSPASTRRSRSSTAALLGAGVTLVVFQLFF